MAVTWVTAKWLRERSEEDAVRIIDTQPRVHDYFKAHIPGALYLSEWSLRSTDCGMPEVFNEKCCIADIFSRSGIDEKTPVVVYTGEGALFKNGDYIAQYMLAYTLERFGHKDVRILDGGMDLWKAESYPLTKEFPKIERTQFSPNIRDDIFIEYQDFYDLHQDAEVQVLDSRSPLMYEGQGPWSKPGHIPGSINMPWRTLVEEENPAKLLEQSHIEQSISQRGISRKKDTICTCGTGREATALFLILKHLLKFRHVRIFEGSFTRWSAEKENKSVVGKVPYYEKE